MVVVVVVLVVVVVVVVAVVVVLEIKLFDYVQQFDYLCYKVKVYLRSCGGGGGSSGCGTRNKARLYN